METVEHELTLQLGDGNGKLADAGLSPPSVDISDIVAAAQHGCGGFEFVVREVHARLAARMHRAALIRGKAGFKLKIAWHQGSAATPSLSHLRRPKPCRL